MRLPYYYNFLLCSLYKARNSWKLTSCLLLLSNSLIHLSEFEVNKHEKFFYCEIFHHYFFAIVIFDRFFSMFTIRESGSCVDSFFLWKWKLCNLPYRRAIYELLNRMSSRIVQVVAASGLAQEFWIVLPAKDKHKNSTSSVYSRLYGLSKPPWFWRF